MRLIDADALKQCAAIMATFEPIMKKALAFVKSLVDMQPTIEATTVVHGRWISHNKGQNNWCECSECNTVGSPFWKRCPVCEAKMDGGEKDV